ncbi:8-amino-7-oxononanoate synthase [Rickettsia endosymbiont of Polydrusus tereticollis]|uniref:aminotransferase class I/II-fold pyridoxal phosphate-dependent enzyme n=1 Tax=Rickettsia endosymbiont of Polydrusus tereticollis TaxID=3066251 RepID=UPI00313307EB
MYELYKQYLSTLHNTGKYRKLPELEYLDQKTYVNFSTNDYLALSHHPCVIKAAKLALDSYGVGATGSRLLSGNNKLFESLENKIAQDKETEAALIFNSGFQTNFSVLSSLLDSKILGTKALVFFDKLNHSSLYQAVFLSGAELIRYHHNDIEHLSSLLNKYENDQKPKFIVTETIFGMDGDILPIHEIISLAEKHRAFLYLDEAHATGIIGHYGYGLSTTVNMKHIPHLIMGTFSKALGGSGGYIACSQILKDYLINKAPGFIYSTASSPMVIGAASKAWDMIKDFEEERNYLFSLGATLRAGLTNLGLDIGLSSSHIIPIILGTEELAIKAKENLLQNRVIASCIRPPTVPPGSSRIRIALNISHKEQDIVQLLKVLKTL